jgi:hypothetical protein
MAIIFISHSKRDERLVLNIKKILENVGHTPIIEEFIPQEKQLPIPYEEIRTNVTKCEFLFVFLTDNVIATPYTQNWVIHEITLASSSSKNVYVFERIGNPIPFPIPYLTDYALFDPDNTEDILTLQELTKNLGKLRRDLLTAGGGALLGSALGPLGMALGAVIGYAVGPKPKMQPKVKCNHCNITFNYYSQYREFNCPSCRRKIDLR